MKFKSIFILQTTANATKNTGQVAYITKEDDTEGQIFFAGYTREEAITELEAILEEIGHNEEEIEDILFSLEVL